MIDLNNLTDITYMVKARTEGITQNHPFHVFDVWEHILTSVSYFTELTHHDLTTDESYELARIMMLHDVGKPDVKGINPKTGYHTFYGHAKASVEFCIENNISLTELERDLILEHDNCKSWVNGKKLNKYIEHHGEIFRKYLIKIVEADSFGQSELGKSNKDVVKNLQIW